MVRRSRTPQGVRGLKRIQGVEVGSPLTSHSARSAWIETRSTCIADSRGAGRTPQGVRGLKLKNNYDTSKLSKSHSARSAWIETPGGPVYRPAGVVALRKECVD